MEHKSFFIKSYGCQMNVYDSEKIKSLLQNKGLEHHENYDDADVVILNTCNIREKAAHKVYSDIGRINHLDKDKTIAVVGCVAQAENTEMLKKNQSIDIVLGPQSYHLLPTMLDDVKDRKIRSINTEFIVNEKFDYLSEQGKPKGISSFVTIQEGCDKFCSFCVVPYTRGPEYSRSFNSIIDEVNSMVNDGAREIVLLGQNVNAYQFKNGNKIYRLSDLIDKLSTIRNLKRIRYTTSHPINMDDELINLHSNNKKLMPFLHLPVQSGSSKILKMMNRKYDIEFYRDIISKIRDKNPNIEISSDFIIGYPGENEKDFINTLELIDDIKFTQSYSFIYSARPGTKSAVFDDNLPKKVKSERLKILQSKLTEIQHKFNDSYVGNKTSVLIENQSITNPEYYFGRTPHMQSVYIKSNNLINGEEKDIKITSCNHKSLYGTC
tara:strand:- start:261 stop:1571 length:1311 start_codon:yes stop_codon:yes gene_type:complete